MRKPLTTWEIWLTVYADGGESGTLCLRDDPHKMVIITENGHEHDVKLEHTFEAPTGNAANAFAHKFWKHEGEYQPVEGWPDTRYFLDEATGKVESEDVES